MKTSRISLSPREVRLARFFLVGFALTLAPLGAQTATQPTTTGATTPGSSPATVVTPPHANTSFYNAPSTTSTATATAPTAPPMTPAAKSGSIAPNVNAGGGSGSGQAGGSSSPSNP